MEIAESTYSVAFDLSRGCKPTSAQPPDIDATAWVAAVLLDPDMEYSRTLMALPIQSQVLAIELLSTAARAALAVGGFDPSEFVRTLMPLWTQWIAPDRASQSD
jgi:hypothetical protein